MTQSGYEIALRAAAQAAGRPLLQHEIAAISKACDASFSRETLRIRFLNVIRGAGYTGEAPESICNHYLAEYMKDVPSFVDMLHRYETQDYDPE